ncbi:MAG TPA: hypothetical protein VFE78_35560 [Gemmataceae bacterium]|nr:hypothetical protein [Gemmataceae bacterium]
MPSPEKRRPAPAGKPPAVGVERVKCACGHEAELTLFDDKKDRTFRAARRQKLAGRPCPDCRRKAHADLVARQMAEAARRKAARPAAPAREEKAARPRGRLPHGAAFAVAYDGGAERWAGSLTVPTPEGGKVFQGEAGAVVKLLSALDHQYRDWLAAQAPQRPAAGSGGGEVAGPV